MPLNDFYIKDANIYRRKDIAEFAYSDGDTTENELLRILQHTNDLSVGSKELAGKIFDWPSRYHFSGQRVDLLRPLQSFINSKKVLEIGSGCGAITRWLGESGANVTSLEGSVRRARITAERCRDLSNVEVVSDSFESFQTDEKYDVVLLIGVLEYSNLFVKGENPPVELLQRAKKLMKPDGIIVIAIENKLGIKYFAGAPEDHVGEAYVGIENRYTEKTAVTYGKQELQSILSDAGFGDNEFFYPYPDYKFPSLILRDKAFDTEGLNKKNLLVPVNDPPQSKGYYPSFVPSLVWEQVANNDLARELSNSFLVIAGNGSSQVVPENEIVFIYSSSRNKGYRKSNIFSIEEKGNIVVKRESMDSTDAPADGRPILQHIVNEEYFAGDLLFLKLNRILSTQGWTIDDITNWARPYYNVLLEHAFEQGGKNLMHGKFADLTPFNVLEDHGNLVHFDQEWEITEDIPMSFIFFRGLYYSLSRPLYVACPAAQTPITSFELISQVLKALGDNTENVVTEFMDLEHKYFRFIGSDETYRPVDFRLHVLPSSTADAAYVNNNLRLVPLNTLNVQVYYTGANDVFAEKDSVFERIDISPEKKKYSLTVRSDVNVGKLRIDFARETGMLNLHSLIVRSASGAKLFDWIEDTDVPVEMNNIVSLSNIREDHFMIFLTNDPMFIFPIETTPGGSNNTLKIEFELSSVSPEAIAQLGPEIEKMFALNNLRRHDKDPFIAQSAKDNIIKLNSELSAFANRELRARALEAEDDLAAHREKINQLENRFKQRDEEINRLKQVETNFTQVAANNDQLVKTMKWYEATYVNRSLAGIIKDRMKRFFKRVYLWILNTLLGLGMVKNRYVLTYLLEYARDNGIKASMRGVRNSFREHGFKTFKNLRQIGLSNLKQSYKRENKISGIDPLSRQEEYTIEKMEKEIAGFKQHPKFSIILPTYNTKPALLQMAIQSVVSQSYTNWELCITDDGSTSNETKRVLRLYRGDDRVKISFLPQNKGISEASNVAITSATGDFLALFDHDDELTPDALFWMAKEINEHPDADIIYSDECKINERGERSDHFLKPAWSPELLFNMMYIGHLTVYRKSFLADKVGLFRTEYNFSQDYDLALRATEQTNKIYHIERILYYWRETEGSASVGDKPYARRSNLAALEDAMKRRGIDADIIDLPTANRVKLHIKQKPLVSIIVPTDSFDNLKETIENIVNYTGYDAYEILPVTNSGLIEKMKGLNYKNTRFIAYDKPYNFSDKCNVGAAHAKGEIVIFFNDDVRPMALDWLENTIEYLFIPGVGGTSPKLIYEDDSIQYAGMVTGVRNLTGTSFHTLHKDSTAYINFPQSVRDVSILSGACLAMRRDLFELVGGFDAVNTPSAHSDVDLSFKILEQGLRCVYTPHATLRHIGHLSLHEYDKSQEKARKKDKADIFLLKRWPAYTGQDPYFTSAMRNLLYHDSPDPIEIYAPAKGTAQSSTKDIILVCHDLTLSGAPIMLLNICKLLLNKGYFVVVFCEKDGPLRKLYQKEGVTVIIDSLVLKQHPSFYRFAKNFDYILCNTAVTWPVVKQMQDTVKTAWWLQEAKVLDLFTCNPEFIDTLKSAKNLIGVSDYSLAWVKEYNQGYTKFYNACFDFFDPVIHRKHLADNEKIIFCIIGSIEPRKGHDIFFDAITKLSPAEHARMEVRVVGRTLHHEFERNIKEKVKHLNFINFVGEVSNVESIQYLAGADVLVTPSRDDPFPVILVEAFCMAKTCIVSDNTGFAELIEQGENGFIFRNEDAEQLADVLRRICANPGKLDYTGMNARETYLEHLTIDKLETNIIPYLDSIPEPADPQQVKVITKEKPRTTKQKLLA